MATPSNEQSMAGTKTRIIFEDARCEVFSYPSTGGHVRGLLTRPELDWLELTDSSKAAETNPTFPIKPECMHAFQNAEDEDRLALRMMQIGCRWWPNKTRRRLDLDIPYGHHLPPDLAVAYPPSGGVLVLKTCADDSHEYENLRNVSPRKPKDFRRLYLCRTMEERSAVLRAFGAIFYSTLEECSDLPKLLEDGIATGRYYEALMDKMADREYLMGWTESL